MIGSLGDVIFETSTEKILNFDDFKYQVSGRWSKHDVLAAKPKSQFTGPELDTVSFTMRFDVMLGVNPKEMLDKLSRLVAKGEAVLLIIGGKPLGSDKWTIESINQSWKTVDNKGNILVATADVTLKEYV